MLCKQRMACVWLTCLGAKGKDEVQSCARSREMVAVATCCHHCHPSQVTTHIIWTPSQRHGQTPGFAFVASCRNGTAWAGQHPHPCTHRTKYACSVHAHASKCTCTGRESTRKKQRQAESHTGTHTEARAHADAHTHTRTGAHTNTQVCVKAVVSVGFL